MRVTSSAGTVASVRGQVLVTAMGASILLYQQHARERWREVFAVRATRARRVRLQFLLSFEDSLEYVHVSMAIIGMSSVAGQSILE